MRSGGWVLVSTSLVVACAGAPSPEPAAVVIGPAPASSSSSSASAPPADSAGPSAASAAVDPEAETGATAAEIDRRVAARVKRIGPDDVEAPRAVIDDVIEHTAALTRDVRIRPVIENGTTVGLLLQRVRSESWLGAIGLQDGDVLQTINGYSLTTPDRALEAYSRLRTASQITIGFRRGAKARVTRIHLR